MRAVRAGPRVGPAVLTCTYSDRSSCWMARLPALEPFLRANWRGGPGERRCARGHWGAPTRAT